MQLMLKNSQDLTTEEKEMLEYAKIVLGDEYNKLKLKDNIQSKNKPKDDSKTVIDEYIADDDKSLFSTKITALELDADKQAKVGLFEYKKEHGKDGNKIKKDFSPKLNLGVEGSFKTVELSGKMQGGDKDLGMEGKISTAVYSGKAELGI